MALLGRSRQLLVRTPCRRAALGAIRGVTTRAKGGQPAQRARTNTSEAPLVSPCTRLPAAETSATAFPLAEIWGSRDVPPATACCPVVLTLTRVIRPVRRS